MTTLLNVSGNQKIANLAMSIHETRTESETPDHSPMSPVATPSRGLASKIELSWDSGGTRIRGREMGNDGHIFAEAEVLRGFSEEQVMEETANSSRTRQKTDQRTAQRTAQLAHDRQDAILGRWGTTFRSSRTIMMCFAFFSYNISPQQVYKATKMWQVLAVGFDILANYEAPKKQKPRFPLAVCYKEFCCFCFKFCLHTQKSLLIPRLATLPTGLSTLLYYVIPLFAVLLRLLRLMMLHFLLIGSLHAKASHCINGASASWFTAILQPYSMFLLLAAHQYFFCSPVSQLALKDLPEFKISHFNWFLPLSISLIKI